MNIVNKLTLRHLKENKGRTVVTTLGICVCVAMITAVFVALATFMNLFAELELFSTGDYHAVCSEVSMSQIDALKQDDRIDEIGFHLNCEKSFLLSDRASDRAGVGEYLAGDEVYINEMVTGDYDGTLPKNENELAIEQRLLEENNLNLAIGDKISFSKGNRYVTEDGNECITFGCYGKEEEFRADSDEQEYTITAILHNNPATRNTPIIIGMSKEELNAPMQNISIRLKEVNHKSYKILEEIFKENNIENYRINSEYLEMCFAFGGDNTFAISLLSLCAIVLVIIMIASVVLIYNAFAMSINERVRYLGMLASVGATKKQKKLSVYFEGLILGVVAIPIGMLAGVTGIGVTLKVLGSKIISTGMINGISDDNMQMKIVFPVWVIVAIVLMSLVTIFISSFVPSRKASRITPIDAIRQTNEVKVKAKGLKSSKLVRLIFGYEGELANKNLKRNGRKARVITASIAMSVILFLSCNYFCNIFVTSVDAEANMPYQVTASVGFDDKEKLTTELDNMKNVDDYYCALNSFSKLDKEDIKVLDIAKPENVTLTYRRLFSSGRVFYKNIIDDERFNELCRDNKIDSKQFYGDEYKVLLLNNISHNESGSKVFTDNVIGTDISEIFDVSDIPLTVGGLVDFNSKNSICSLTPINGIAFYIPLSQDMKLAKQLYDEDTVYMYNVAIETKEHSEVAQELGTFLEQEEIEPGFYSDILDSAQAMNTIAFIIQVLVYGFISLISLITIFNIVNTISTGVLMRRKEFAMLKSVGITPKGFNKMMVLESIFYGLKALVFALPISVLVSFGMHSAMKVEGMIPFEINYGLYALVILAVFVVVGVSLLASVSKIKQDNIIEALKADIN